jgi:hypothetical protein
LALEYLKLPKASEAKRYQQIRLASHIELIKVYCKKRGELDKSILKVGQLIEKLNNGNKGE